ncbi:MAG: hypothetical protein JWL62_315 [Hyphomicrobiales bacterium]|nr:hypothetical protein [Hyphomicrobiales bacterium]
MVLASDSAVQHRGQLYYSAQKTMQLLKGMPIGVLLAGDGAIGNKAFIDILKDFGAQAISRPGATNGFARGSFTVESAVRGLQDYLRSMAPMQVAKIRTTLIIAGYSIGSDTPEVWNLVFDSTEGVTVSQIWSPSEYGICWEGSGECIHRLLSDDFQASAASDWAEGSNHPPEPSSPTLVTPGMPIHDAIDLTRFLMDTTVDYVRFRADLQPKTVGGPIDMAVITRHEGFRWVQRKRLSSSSLQSAR